MRRERDLDREGGRLVSRRELGVAPGEPRREVAIVAREPARGPCDLEAYYDRRLKEHAPP
jgi:hypothetical protein